MEHEMNLVYGTVSSVAGEDGDLVFAPDDRATNLATLQEALETATTWGQFRAMIAPDDAEIIDQAMVDFAGESPADDATFELPKQIRWGNGDMPWDRWLAGEMIDWVPQEIQVEFGTVAATAYQGNILVLDPEREYEIVAKFEALGCRCFENGDLLQAAAGGLV